MLNFQEKHILAIPLLIFHYLLILKFFSPFSSKKAHMQIHLEDFFQALYKFYLIKIALSDKSFPYISKSTSKVNHRIAQSTFHCNLQLPFKTFVTIFSPLLSKITSPVFFSYLLKVFQELFLFWGIMAKMGNMFFFSLLSE